MNKLLKSILKSFLIVVSLSLAVGLIILSGTLVYKVFEHIAIVNEWSQETKQLVGVIVAAFLGSWAMIAFLDYSDPFNGD